MNITSRMLFWIFAQKVTLMPPDHRCLSPQLFHMQFVEVCAQKTKTPETINKIFLNNQNEQKYEKGIIGIQLKNVQIMKVKFCWHSWEIQGKYIRTYQINFKKIPLTQIMILRQTNKIIILRQTNT